MPKGFSPELRERAVRMVYDRQAREGGPRAASIRHRRAQLGVGTETLRIWVIATAPPRWSDRRAARGRESLFSAELAEARRANEILKAASAFFAAELDRPTTKNDRVRRHASREVRVEAICRILSATEWVHHLPRYRAAKNRPASRSQSVRDEMAAEEVQWIHQANYSVYGVRRCGTQMRHAGWNVGRDQVARLDEAVSGVPPRSKACHHLLRRRR